MFSSTSLMGVDGQRKGLVGELGNSIGDSRRHRLSNEDTTSCEGPYTDLIPTPPLNVKSSSSES